MKVGAPLVAFAEVRARPTAAPWSARSRPARRRPRRSRTGERGGRTVTVRATPAVRALARRKGVDLALIAGSGADGMITAADVEQAATTLAEAGPLEPLRGVRRAMALAHGACACRGGAGHRQRRGRRRRLAGGRRRHDAAGARDRRRLRARAGAERLVRLGRARAGGCTARSTSASPSTPRTACSCRCCATSPTATPADLRRGPRADEGRHRAPARIPPEELRGATITLSNFGIARRPLRRAGGGAAAGRDPLHRQDPRPRPVAVGDRRSRCGGSCRCR